MGVFSAANEKARARATMVALGEAITFTGGAGPVASYGYVEQSDDYIGGDVQSVDYRYVVALLVEDVGSAYAHDVVTDAEGQEWILADKRPSADPWVTEWWVKKK